MLKQERRCRGRSRWNTKASPASPQSSCLKAHQETRFHLSAKPLLWLFFLDVSLTDCRQSLLDGSDQRSQVAEREFREVTVRMDRAGWLPLDDLPGLVL